MTSRSHQRPGLRWRRWLLAILLLPVVFWALTLMLWRVALPPATPLMVIRSIEAGRWIDYRPRRLDHIASALAHTVIAAEDARFCQHAGIDFDAVEDAVNDYRERGRLRGASTITMQVARNLFLWDGGGLFRKALELPLALLLDATWPKRRILEVYLNIAEWGPGIFGAEAAAQRHFGKPASQLNGWEAARLAAVLPSPRRWSASNPSGYVVSRSHTLRVRAGQLGRAQTACWSE
jgi:monofunctional biosynthetic peptidoglycan transglycosylase